MNQLLFSILVAISAILGSYIFMSWTLQQQWSPIINFLFAKTSTSQLSVLTTLGYYLILLFTCCITLLQIYKWIIKNPAQQVQNNLMVKSIYEALKQGFYQFVTFGCVFYYFAQRNSSKKLFQLDSQRKQYLVYFCFWFLIANLLFIFTSFMTTIAQVNLKLYGVIFTFFIYAFIIGQSLGFNLVQTL